MENQYTTYTIQLNGLTQEQDLEVFLKMGLIAHELSEEYGVTAGDFVTTDKGEI